MSTPDTVDLLIVDSTPGGLAAAISAARLGLSTLVVTEDRHIGGMQTAGLGNTNSGQRQTIGGLPDAFHQRVHSYYQSRYGAASEQVEQSHRGHHFEPSVAELIYESWLAELGIPVLRERRVVAVERQGERLRAVVLDDGRRIHARWFVDASYEGDLMRAAGCSLIVGRESRDAYGESLAGVRYPPERLGAADALTQAYDFRLCLTRDPANRVPFREPAAYDPARFEDWRRHLARLAPTRLHQVVPLNMMPNAKTDSRCGEWPGGCTAYPTASHAEREAIVRAHRDYTEQWLWFCLTDPVIPTALRDELAAWGYAADEFADNDNWPYHIYVRESSRLLGDWVMTQHDVEGRFQPDSIGIGSFFMDVHPVQTLRDETGDLIWEGHLGVAPVLPYEIPYRVLLPKRAEAANAWSLFALSASHVAFSTLRMEPYFMMMGQAAGTAAALLQATGDRAAADIDTAALQAQLTADGALLDARPFDQSWP